MAKILIIDDDGVVRDALTVFLTRGGHSVLCARDGAAGIGIFRKEKPDLVVLDRNLPVISGSGVFGEMRNISRNVPIVILTAYDDPADAALYLERGAAAFLSKGDGLSGVLSAINNLLGCGSGKAAAPPSPAVNTPGKATVLVADDDEPTRRLLARCMTDAGYSVLTAADGIEAERLALERGPDIALLDIFMPGKDGVKVLETIAVRLPSTGVIMISGNEDEELARECLRRGAIDYVTKPPNLEQLSLLVKTKLLMRPGGGGRD